MMHLSEDAGSTVLAENDGKETVAKEMGYETESPPQTAGADPLSTIDKLDMSLKIETLSAKDAQSKLSQLRAGRGGRTSKYHPVLEAVQKRKGSQIVTIDGLSPNEVQGLRAYLYRYLDSEEWTVKSARTDDDGKQYRVFIGKESDFD